MLGAPDWGQEMDMPVKGEMTAELLREMQGNAQRATDFLKALAHEGRLMILCHLATGEKSVTELEHLLHARQAAVSQQLARLRHSNFVQFRREGKAMYYSLPDGPVREMVGILYQMFCDEKERAAKR